MSSEAGIASSLVLVNAFLPKSYDLKVSVDHSKPNFSGSVVIPLTKNDQCVEDSSTFSMILHAHKLVVMKATLQMSDVGSIPLKIVTLRDRMMISLSTSEVVMSQITEKASPTVTISFMGCINSIKTFNDDTYGVFKTNYSDSIEGKSDNFVIATHCQPFGCRTIFPVIDELVIKVPIKLTITTKSLFKAVSNALLERTTIVDMTENSVFEFKPTPPISPSIFGFVIGDLECVECLDSSIPIRAFVTKGDGPLINYALKVAEALLPKFVDTLGVQYPLEKFDIVTLPFLSDGVMENWGMVTIFRNSVLMDANNADDSGKFQVRQLIAHQLTHQWIGNLVTLDDWKYMWLIEAFATWVGNYLLSLAKIENSDFADYEIDRVILMESFMDKDCLLQNRIPSLHEHMMKLRLNKDSRTNSIFERDAYEKGMILVNMIASLFKFERNEESFKGFFLALKNVLEGCKHQTIKPFELWQQLNLYLSVDLLTFVQTWTQYEGYPLVKVKISGDKIKFEQNRFFFNDDVNNVGLENPPFHVPLSLKILTETKSF